MGDFVASCDDLKMSKRKIMIIDFRKSPPSPLPAAVKGVDVEQVETEKHLGVVLDNRLTHKSHADPVCRDRHR